MGSAHDFSVLWRFRWLLLTLAPIVAIATYVISDSQEKTYKATATAQVQAGGNDALSVATDEQAVRVSNVNAELARSNDVLERAAKSLRGAGGVQSFSDHVDVTARGDVGLLDFAGTDHQPVRAAAYARAYVTAFTNYVNRQAEADRARQLAPLQKQLADVNGKIREREALVPRDLRSSDPRLTSLTSQAGALQTQIAQQSGTPVASVRVIQQPTVPTSPDSPKPVRDALLALLAFILLGAGLTYLGFALTNRYESASAAAEDLDLPLLGELPRSGPSRPRAQEALRALRTNLMFVLTLQPLRGRRQVVHNGNGNGNGNGHGEVVDAPARTVLVTGPERGSGKSYVTANLCRALVAEGRHVIAVDADLRRPTLAGDLMVPSEPGLGDLLTGRRHDLDNLIFEVPRSPIVARRGGELDVISAGGAVQDPVEALSSEAMSQTVEILRDRGESLIVFDTPPALGLADATVLARHCDGVIFVIDSKRTSRRRARRAVQALRSVHAPILGFVYNRAPRGEVAYINYQQRFESEPAPEPIA
jgi:capsular exopolysaccharide synthesis family protein